MVFEDFNTFVEVDPAFRLTQTATRSTYTQLARGDALTYLYKDYGAGYFTSDETILFTYEITELNSVSGTSRTLNDVLLIQNVLSERTGPYIAIFIVEQGTSDTLYTLRLRTDDGFGSDPYDDAVNMAVGTTYYCTLVRNNLGETLTLYIYDDPGRTSSVDTLVVNNNGLRGLTFQYLMTPSEALFTSDTTDYTSGYLENLDLGKITEATEDLKAEFKLPDRDSADLKAVFMVAQDSEDLKAVFVVKQASVELKAHFMLRTSTSRDLFAEFSTNLHNGDESLYAKFAVRRIYDLSDNGGIGFFWQGVGRGQIDIQILTPTGSWAGKFPDYGPWTWVPLLWEDLREVDLNGSLPDKTQITGFFWTYHSAGIRHLDGLYGLPKGGDPDVKGITIIRHAAYNDLSSVFLLEIKQNILSKFIVRHPNILDLPAEFRLRQETYDLKATLDVGQNSFDIKAEMFIQYKFKDLKAVFTLRQNSADLKAVFEVEELRLETYTVDGVTNNPSIGGSFVLVEEMTKTLTLSTGDKVIIDFIGEAYIGSLNYIETKIQAGGADITPVIRNGTYLTSAGSEQSRIGIVAHAIYTAVSDGNVTFQVLSRRYSGTTYWVDDRRQLTLQHFY